MRRALAVLTAIVSLTPAALAHGGHDPRLKISVSGAEIRLEVGIEAGGLGAFDTDKNGVISIAEYETRYAEISDFIDTKISLSLEPDEVLPAYFSDAPIVDRDHIPSGGGVKYIKILRRWKLPSGAESLTVMSGLSGLNPDVLISRSGAFDSMADLKICTASEKLRNCR